MRGSAGRVPLLIAAGSVALAALSLAAPLEPRYDAWGWILWGRDLVGPHGFDTTPYPSWKPGAAVITTLVAPAGELAPKLWLLVARTGALLALAVTWRLGARLGGPLAGTVAALGLALTDRWFVYFSRGTAEGLLVLFVLAAVDRHLAGHRDQALALGVAAALLRPEAWPFLLLYAGWRLIREPRRFPVILALTLIAPALWFGGDWLGAGDPFWASKHADMSAQGEEAAARAHPWLEVLSDAAGELLLAPLVLAALVAVGLALRRPRDQVVLGLAALAACWIAVVAVGAETGYPGLPRFMLPAGAIGCVLAGVGLVRMRDAIPGGRALAVAILVAAGVVAVPRLAGLPDHYRTERSVARTQQDLETAIARLGGRDQVRRCRVTTNQPLRPRLAWELDLPAITLVHLVPPALVFRNQRGPYGAFEKLARVAGEPGRPRLVRVLATERWEVYAAIEREPGCPLLQRLLRARG